MRWPALTSQSELGHKTLLPVFGIPALGTLLMSSPTFWEYLKLSIFLGQA